MNVLNNYRFLRVGTTALFALTFGSVAFPRYVTAQTAVSSISSAPRCTSCSIRVTKVTTLGSRSDPHLMYSPDVAIARDSKGYFYAASRGLSWPTAEVVQYDANGKYIKAIGRKGQGPGELRDLSGLRVGTGDSLFVLGGRMNLFALPSAQFVRSYPLRLIPSQSFLPVRNGRLIVNAWAPTPQHAGYSIFRLSSAGEIDIPYQSVSFLTEPTGQPVRQRVIGQGPGDTFWSVEPMNYVLEQWSVDGVRLSWLSRDADWFVPAIASREQDAKLEKTVIRRVGPGHNVAATTRADPQPRRPVGALVGLWSDSPSRLWVVGVTGDAAWRPPARGAKPASRDGTLDSVVEIIDPITQSLFASVRIDQAISMVVAPGYLATVNMATDGFVEMVIWRIELLSQ